MLVLGSKHDRLSIWVKPPEDQYFPDGNKVTRDRGVRLQFDRGKYFVTEEAANVCGLSVSDLEKMILSNPNIKRKIEAKTGELFVIEDKYFGKKKDEAGNDVHVLQEPEKSRVILECPKCDYKTEKKAALVMHDNRKHKYKKAAVAA